MMNSSIAAQANYIKPITLYWKGTYYANRRVAVCQYLPLFGEYTPSNIELHTLIKVATDLIKVFPFTNCLSCRLFSSFLVSKIAEFQHGKEQLASLASSFVRITPIIYDFICTYRTYCIHWDNFKIDELIFRALHGTNYEVALKCRVSKRARNKN